MVMKQKEVDVTAVPWDWWKGCAGDWGPKVREGSEHDELRYWVDGGAIQKIPEDKPSSTSREALGLRGQEPGVWKQTVWIHG